VRMRLSSGVKNNTGTPTHGLPAGEPLDSATKYLAAAEHEQALPALGHPVRGEVC
jgi:hypothetical protein